MNKIKIYNVINWKSWNKNQLSNLTIEGAKTRKNKEIIVTIAQLRSKLHQESRH